MTFAIPLLLFASLLPQAQAGSSSATQQADAFQSGAVTELFIGRTPGARVLFFRLDRGEPGAEPQGVARWVRTPGRGFGEHRSEIELFFFENKTRLSHVETMFPGERKLLWREVRPQAGRTILLKGAASTGFSLTDTAGGEVRRRDIGGLRGYLPLEIVESVQKGQDYLGSFSIFQPLAGAFETLQVETKNSRDANGYAVRDLYLRAPDGVVRASFRFRRGEIFEFGWRSDGPRARRITPEEYQRHVGRHVPDPKVSLGEGENEPEKERAPTPLLDGPHPRRRGSD